MAVLAEETTMIVAMTGVDMMIGITIAVPLTEEGEDGAVVRTGISFLEGDLLHHIIAEVDTGLDPGLVPTLHVGIKSSEVMYTLREFLAIFVKMNISCRHHDWQMCMHFLFISRLMIFYLKHFFIDP